MAIEKDKELLVEKVRKLLRLADSSNEHEAALAAEKAQELMLRHGLGLAQIAAARGERTIGIGEIRLDRVAVDPWRRRLAGAVAEPLGGELIYETWSRARGCLIFLGARDSVAGMVDLYEYLEGTLTILSATATARRKDRRVHGRTYRVSWLTGAVGRLRERLSDRARAIVGESESNGRALVLVRSALERYSEEQYPDVRQVGYALSAVDERAYRAGEAAADELSLDSRRLTGPRALAR